jgi:hypothetical protein
VSLFSPEASVAGASLSQSLFSPKAAVAGKQSRRGLIEKTRFGGWVQRVFFIRCLGVLDLK